MVTPIENRKRDLGDHVIKVLSSNVDDKKTRYVPWNKYDAGLHQTYPFSIPPCGKKTLKYRFLYDAIHGTPKHPWILAKPGAWILPHQRTPVLIEAHTIARHYDSENQDRVCQQKWENTGRSALYYQLPQRQSGHVNTPAQPSADLGRQRVLEYYRRRINNTWSYVDAAAYDPAHVGRIALPLYKHIAPALGDVTPKKYQLLQKILYLGWETGMDKRDLTSIMEDLIDHPEPNIPEGRKFSRTDARIYKLFGIISLRFAAMLHRDNVKMCGSGLYDNFEKFAHTAEWHIRDNDFVFQKLPEGVSSSVNGFYSSSEDSMSLHPLDSDMPFYKRILLLVHENYHGYQDLKGVLQERSANEVPTFEIGFKLQPLLNEWFSKRAGFAVGNVVQKSDTARRAQAVDKHPLLYARMGADKGIVAGLRAYYQEYLSRRTKAEGFARSELDGMVNTTMREAMLPFARLYLFKFLLLSCTHRHTENIRRLHETGSREITELRIRGAAAYFNTWRFTMRGRNPSFDYPTDMMMRTLTGAMTMKKGLYLLGLENHWHSANRVVFSQLAPSLEKQLVTFPSNFDGISRK